MPDYEPVPETAGLVARQPLAVAGGAAGAATLIVTGLQVWGVELAPDQAEWLNEAIPVAFAIAALVWSWFKVSPVRKV